MRSKKETETAILSYFSQRGNWISNKLNKPELSEEKRKQLRNKRKKKRK